MLELTTAEDVHAPSNKIKRMKNETINNANPQEQAVYYEERKKESMNRSPSSTTLIMLHEGTSLRMNNRSRPKKKAKNH